MKRIRIIAGIVISLIVIICLVVFYQYNQAQKRMQEIQNQATVYLNDKYGKEIKFIGEGSYYDSVYLFTACFEDSDVEFRVRYISENKSFEDEFLENVVIENVKSTLYEKCLAENIAVENIVIGSIIGPYAEVSNRLYDRYKQGNFDIEDISKNEQFSRVAIYAKEWNDEQKAKVHNIIEDMGVNFSVIDFKI